METIDKAKIERADMDEGVGIQDKIWRNNVDGPDRYILLIHLNERTVGFPGPLMGPFH